MVLNTGALVIDTPGDAIGLVNTLLQMDRPTDEVLAALDQHAGLLPDGFGKVRAAAAKGDRVAAQMALRIALDERPRPG